MNTPIRLGRVPEETSFYDKCMVRIDTWAMQYAFILLPLSGMGLCVLIVILAYTLVGISATESGALRNFLIRGV